MSGRELPLSREEFVARVQAAAPSTPDDVSITLDGRRLDSREAVLAWLAEVEADRAAGRGSNVETSFAMIEKGPGACARPNGDRALLGVEREVEWMGERIGQEVSTDQTLLSYARDLWASGEYKAWRTHMEQDIADGLNYSRGTTQESAADYPEEA
jgi:hypothetical protein